MKREEFKATEIPETPGVYLFRDTKKQVLYVGRAVNLRNRVRSYFSERLEEERGSRLVEAVERTKEIEIQQTESILEAYLLEAALIKKYEPLFNVRDKDNKSFQFVGITEEDFPRVLVIRGRQLAQENTTFRYIFGPFPKGTLLKEALRLLRTIFPYRDTCTPQEAKEGKKRKCFRAELNLCPGMCAGLIDKKEYARHIQNIALFFNGKKKEVLKRLEKELKHYSKERKFEKAEEVYKRIFALTHIQDAVLLKQEDNEGATGRQFRIEAYDVAHLAGKNTVGVMVVLIDGVPEKSEYRTFTIQKAGGSDTKALRETMTRRLTHPEWKFPDLVVMDGGKIQLSLGKTIIQEHGLTTPVVAVVKNERHAPKAILGESAYKHTHEKSILSANAEAHRFARLRHEKKRIRQMLT